MNKNNFLIVIDMQNDFITGALGSAEAQKAVAPAAAHIKKRRAEGWTLLYTLDTHGDDYLSTAEGKKLPVTHCVRGTDGWKLDKTIEEALGDAAMAVEKPAFGSLRLPEKIKAVSGGAPEKIELLGVCTDICVVSNALILKAAFVETPISVIASACAGTSPEGHEAALKTMAACQIDII